jgi:hypothetical protein
MNPILHAFECNCEECIKKWNDTYARTSPVRDSYFKLSESPIPEPQLNILGMDGYETIVIDAHNIYIRPKWIRVEDAMPEEHEVVLVYCISNDSIYLDFVSNPKDGNRWAVIDKDDISHWMPLPSPPEIKND